MRSLFMFYFYWLRRQHRWFLQFLGFSVSLLIALLYVALVPTEMYGQPQPDTPPISSPEATAIALQPISQLPPFIAPITAPPPPPGVERRGALEATGVRLDGRELFKIASTAVFNRNDLSGQIPVEVRARQIEANLQQVVGDGLAASETLDSETLTVVIETINEQPVLFARDAKSVEPQVLLTVTLTDAQFHAVSPVRLAEQWRDILDVSLRTAIELRQPQVLQQQLVSVLKLIAVSSVITLGLGTLWTILRHRKERLEERKAAEASRISKKDAQPSTPPIESSDSPSLSDLSHYFGLQQRLQLITLFRWLLFWAIALLWAGTISFGLNSFPQTRPLARIIISIPLVLLFAWFLSGLVNRLADLLIDRYIQNCKQDKTLTEANLQRISTIAKAIKNLKLVLVYSIAILWGLQHLNLIPASVLTLGALLALVLSFAAQSLVRDVVNGLLILIEDQFRIGDFVRIGTSFGLPEVDGLVENLNLRITQIRSTEGNLISLSNSSIAKVENMSRSWARADMQFEVGYNSDVNLALLVIRETIDQMEQDPEWKTMILDTHEVLGIDHISHTGIVVRVWIKTLPLKQWLVAREFRRRLKIAFDHHHIQIGIPQQIWLDNTNAV